MTTSTETTDMDMATGLPAVAGVPGLTFRPVDLDADLEALAKLISEANIADGEDYAPSPEDLRNDLVHHPQFDASRDMLVGEIDGRLVGGTEHTVRLRAGVLQHQLAGWVRPDMRRRGIGRALLHWAERRSREAAGDWPDTQAHGLTSWIGEHQTGATALLESEGYRPIRYGFMMVRPLSEPIPDAPLPDGLELRPVVEADHERIWDADVEAFRDHWEAAERTDEDRMAMFASSGIDTSLWRVAWDGDEVAGSVMVGVFAEENERLGVSRGWLEHVSVRRPWRRRGLAGALIADSLRALRDRGVEQAALGVDAENPTGALHLYESYGFRRHQTGIAYRKPL